MKKENKWKMLLSPVIFDRYSKSDIFVGLGITTFAMAGIFITSLFFGLIEITNVGFDARMIGYYTGLIFLSAGYEELIFRCILLTILIKVLKKSWIALLITSIYFGYVHLDNDYATVLSAVSNGIGGIMYGLAFLFTRKIWLPWALHFAWNYLQAPILGFPVSGFEVQGIISLKLLDHSWLSGGFYGPEGGIVGISFRFVVIGLVVFWIKKSRGKVKKKIIEQDYIPA
ncbi:CPBP family intramembrane glutamic endopeptidase [Metabacillus endolithicus]|uniref:CPBP family intramembrane glutamic endopeptidase n=1 Tax=Metabacillus endolithicus TaxID=1535204 RepID=A0ABW5BR49_9BACI|nr:CPBP family intramembrane glutamic endopeptidase [Metabacillus endolithicus]UPG63450.1 CPBP family intramembrane metalloprotease [Metabacillus endolithicus]